MVSGFCGSENDEGVAGASFEGGGKADGAGLPNSPEGVGAVGSLGGGNIPVDGAPVLVVAGGGVNTAVGVAGGGDGDVCFCPKVPNPLGNMLPLVGGGVATGVVPNAGTGEEAFWPNPPSPPGNIDGLLAVVEGPAAGVAAALFEGTEKPPNMGGGGVAERTGGVFDLLASGEPSSPADGAGEGT